MGGVVGSSPYLFGGLWFESTSFFFFFFLGGGFVLNFVLFWWQWFYFDSKYLTWIIFLRGIFFLFFLVVEVYLYLFNIHTFIHTNFFFFFGGTVGRHKCWTVCFHVFGHKHVGC